MKEENIYVRLMKLMDLAQVVEIHQISFQSSRSTKLGKPFLRKMYEWYVIYQPNLSFVVEKEGAIVGFLTGTGGYEGGRRRFNYCLPFIILGLLYNPSLLFSENMFYGWKYYLQGIYQKKNVQKVVSAKKTKKKKYVLDSIAVHPNSRGLGIACKLINTFEKAAKEHGADYLTLGVERDNLSAIQLYEKNGWNFERADRNSSSTHYVKKIIDI